MPHQPTGRSWPEDGTLTPGNGSLGPSGFPPLSAYIHIPFCTVRCGYCDFNTYTTGFGEGADLETYAESVIREIELSARVQADAGLPPRRLSTVFFGGGTPSLLPPRAIDQIISSLQTHFGLERGAEVTLEANPDTLDEGGAKSLVKAGVNRFSIGMQSAVPSVLATLDRTHNPESVPRAVEAAKKAGAQTSVDLIYGAPGESLSDWKTSVEAALSLEVDHISAYSLIIEEGTKMGRELSRGLIPEPDPDLEAEKYALADQLLREAGFQWYEISNFSTSKQTRSTHNLAYWRDWDWWGYGPGAHSHIGLQRWWNVKHPRAYAGRLLLGKSPAYAGEDLDQEDRKVERVMLGIRTSDGLPLVELPSSTKVALTLVQEGLLDQDWLAQGRAVLTLRGRLLADLVTRRLLEWE